MSHKQSGSWSHPRLKSPETPPGSSHAVGGERWGKAARSEPVVRRFTPFSPKRSCECDSVPGRGLRTLPRCNLKAYDLQLKIAKQTNKQTPENHIFHFPSLLGLDMRFSKEKPGGNHGDGSPAIDPRGHPQRCPENTTPWGRSAKLATRPIQSKHNSDIFLLFKMPRSNWLSCFRKVALAKAARHARPARVSVGLPSHGPVPWTPFGAPPGLASPTPAPHHPRRILAVVSVCQVRLPDDPRFRLQPSSRMASLPLAVPGRKAGQYFSLTHRWLRALLARFFSDVSRRTSLKTNQNQTWAKA